MTLTPVEAGAIGCIAFLILVFNKVPIGFAFAIVGTIGLIAVRGLDSGLSLLGSHPFRYATMASFLSGPLFILMGAFAAQSRMAHDLYETAYKWMGRFPGGISQATILAGTSFGACCGSSMAGTAAFGVIAYPEMKRYKYDDRLATGCIIAGGSLSSLIPPSIGFIFYGFLTETSIAELFIAGIFPGLLQTGLFILIIYLMCKRNPKLGPPGPSFPLREMLVSLRGVLPVLVVFLVAIGGLYVGVFTPSEAGAAGAFVTFAVALAIRRLNFNTTAGALRDAAQITCFFLTMVIGAMIFNSFLAVTGLTAAIYSFIEFFSFSPYLILSMIFIIYIILGCVMDLGAILMIMMPLVHVPLVNLGFNPVWLGVQTIVLCELGFITPPIGLNSFVLQRVTGVPLGAIFRGAMPFCIVIAVSVAIMTVFPQIVTFLPSTMR